MGNLRHGGLEVSSSWSSVGRMAVDGEIAVIATSDCGLGCADPGGCLPKHLAVDAMGNVYIADTWNIRIGKVAPDGVIALVAGKGGPLAP